MTYFLTKCTTLGRLSNTTLQKFSAKGAWGETPNSKIVLLAKKTTSNGKSQIFPLFWTTPLIFFSDIFFIFFYFCSSFFFPSYFKTWSEVNGGRWGKRALGTRRQSRSHYSPPVCWPCYSLILLFFHSTCFYFCFCFVILAGGSKSFGIHITEKPPRHLVRIVLWLAMGSKGPKRPIFSQKCKIWPKMQNLAVLVQKIYFWGRE